MDARLQHLMDEVLVLEAQAGGAEALDALIRRWQRRLWQHASRLLGREDAAWDACQEAWIGIVRNLSHLDDPAAFGRWAYRIVTHKCMDRLRQDAKSRDLWNDLVTVTPARQTDGAMITDVRSALESMSGPMKVILTLRHIENFAVSEIADILDVPEGTVKSRLHKARTELRMLMEKDHERL